jgi:hypothetical protein
MLDFGDFAAVANRNQVMRQSLAVAEQHHQQQLQVLERQTREIQSKNRIDADRAKLEKQRLEIEKKRLEAEQTERQLQKMQAEKIKQVRMLLADTIISFDQLKKLRPVP